MRVDKLLKEWRQYNKEPSFLKESRGMLRFPKFKTLNQKPEKQSVEITDRRSVEKFIRIAGQQYKNALVKAYKSEPHASINQGLPDILLELKSRGASIDDELVQIEIKNEVNDFTRYLTQRFQEGNTRGAYINFDNFGEGNLDHDGPLFSLMNVQALNRYYQDARNVYNATGEVPAAPRTGDAEKQHEGLHFMFGQMRRKYGAEVYQNVMKVIYTIYSNIDPVATEIIMKYITDYYGSEVNSRDRLFEEITNTTHTILSEPDERTRFRRYTMIHSDETPREVVSGLKRIWKRLIKFSQNVSPEEMGA